MVQRDAASRFSQILKHILRRQSWHKRGKFADTICKFTEKNMIPSTLFSFLTFVSATGISTGVWEYVECYSTRTCDPRYYVGEWNQVYSKCVGV
jgi:hypothetical protein